ncbi:MAG TPA: ABC transporter permease [Acidobacteriaceae bacterium]|nr:ABC transporter permease [Acidobacteriaceae bacterium]
MTALLQDLRYAARMLARSPGFAAIAILTLALGIAADTTLFSVVNGVLLNPLAYPHSGQLVSVNANESVPQVPVSYLNFLDWQRQTRTLSSMAMYRHEDYNLSGQQGPAQRVNGFMISAQFLTTLGLHPAAGRDFNTSDDHLGAAPVALLSNGFWHRRFGGSLSILGKPITLNGADYTVVGILPPGFLFYGVDRDVYIPLGQWTDPSFRDRRIDESAHVVARLAPGVTLAQAQADMDTVAHNLALAYPQVDKGFGVGISLITMKQDIVGNVQPLLIVLLAAVGFLLLLACANVASLLLARSMARSAEFAVRSALGAGRARLIRQLLTESLVLAGLGGVLGLALAVLATKAIAAALPAELPRAGDVAIDTRVLLFTLGVSLLAGIVFGLAPALRTSRTNLQDVLRQAGRGSSGTRHRLQGLFVAVEVAMALVLLVGAGLMLRSLAALWRVNLGYNPDHAVTFSVSLPSNAKTTAADTRAHLRQFDAALHAVPGVQAVSVTLGSRPMIHDSSLPFWIEGRPKPATDNDMPQSLFYLVESGFQRAMGMTLLRGRWITDHDNENTPTVVVIDDAFARAYFPNQNPIGQHVHLVQFDTEAEIVGVVAHVRQWGPGGDPHAAIQAQFFYPYMQTPSKLMPLLANVTAVVLRTEGDPGAVMGPVRQAVNQLNPDYVIYAVSTMNGVVADTLAARRTSMLLLAIFAGLALVLACIGIYGVIAYLVGQRTHEIGVRMALGAERRHVLRLILGQGIRMALAGVVLGIVLALALTRLMSSQLYGVTAHDPLTFAGVALVLVAVALLACWIPARRAMRIDPIVALRYE